MTPSARARRGRPNERSSASSAPEPTTTECPQPPVHPVRIQGTHPRATALCVPQVLGRLAELEGSCGAEPHTRLRFPVHPVRSAPPKPLHGVRDRFGDFLPPIPPESAKYVAALRELSLHPHAQQHPVHPPHLQHLHYRAVQPSPEGALRPSRSASPNAKPPGGGSSPRAFLTSAADAPTHPSASMHGSMPPHPGDDEAARRMLHEHDGTGAALGANAVSSSTANGSLPLIHRVTVPSVGKGRPVARGAARVAARQGVSVGQLKQEKLTILAAHQSGAASPTAGARAGVTRTAHSPTPPRPCRIPECTQCARG